MKAFAKILIIIVLLAAIWLVFFNKPGENPILILQNDFSALQKIESEYSSGNSLFPSTEEKLTALEKELNELKKNASDSTLKEWIDVRLKELAVGKGFFNLQKNIKRIDPSNIDCSNESNPLSMAIIESQKVNSKAAEALNSLNSFEEKHSSFEKSLNFENHKTTSENLQNSAQQTGTELQKYC